MRRCKANQKKNLIFGGAEALHTSLALSNDDVPMKKDR
jgi:hypothetical protein